MVCLAGAQIAWLIGPTVDQQYKRWLNIGQHWPNEACYQDRWQSRIYIGHTVYRYWMNVVIGVYIVGYLMYIDDCCLWLYIYIYWGNSVIGVWIIKYLSTNPPPTLPITRYARPPSMLRFPCWITWNMIEQCKEMAPQWVWDDASCLWLYTFVGGIQPLVTCARTSLLPMVGHLQCTENNQMYLWNTTMDIVRLCGLKHQPYFMINEK